MINHKNTRYGNLVMYEGRILRLHCISPELPSLDTTEFGIGVVGWNDLKEILLTPEILTEKCGFLSDPTGKHWIGDFELYPVGKGFDYDGKVLVTSVHQLQNLYYSISESELPVNF